MSMTEIDPKDRCFLLHARLTYAFVQKDFCPAHSDVAAINKLESTTYYQKSHSIDDYLDEFVELVAEAGYTDPKTTVVKFWKGLDPHIQNTIATMAYGQPSDASPEDWYEAAKTVDQN